jgi:hypothetical protein
MTTSREKLPKLPLNPNKRKTKKRRVYPALLSVDDLRRRSCRWD